MPSLAWEHERLVPRRKFDNDKNKIGIISCFFDPKNVDESIELINNELTNNEFR